MSIYLNTYRSSLVEAIYKFGPEYEKESLAEGIHKACSQSAQSDVDAIQIISTLGKGLTSFLREKKQAELAEKVQAITENQILAISDAMRARHIVARPVILVEEKLDDTPLESPPQKRQHEDPPNILALLPQEVMLQIFSSIPPTKEVALTCRAFRDYSSYFKAQEILRAPIQPYSLSDFGFEMPSEIPNIPSARKFLYERTSLLENIKNQLLLSLKNEIDSSRERCKVSSFIKIAYDRNLFLLFGTTLDRNEFRFTPSVSTSRVIELLLTSPSIAVMQDLAKGFRQKIADEARGLRKIEYTNALEPLTCLPKGIRHCLNVESVQISDSLLRKIPDQIKFLRSMKTLNLAGNCLTSLPEALGCCQSLRSLDVSRNLLKSIPDSVLALPKLTHLTVDEDVALPPDFEKTHTVYRILGQVVREYRQRIFDRFGIGLP